MKTIKTLASLFLFTLTVTTLAADTTIDELWQKLISPAISDDEKREMLNALPEDTLRQLQERDRKEMSIREKEARKQMQISIERLNRGTGQLLGVSHYYERISTTAASQADGNQKTQINSRSEKNLQAFARLVTANSPENNITLWKTYGPIVERIWKTYKDSEVTPEQLGEIEVQLIDPLLKSLEKDVAALPSSPTPGDR